MPLCRFSCSFLPLRRTAVHLRAFPVNLNTYYPADFIRTSMAPRRPLSSFPRLPMRKGISTDQQLMRLKKPLWRRPVSWIVVVGIGAFSIYAFNLVPDRREILSPKHYYSTIWIRFQTSKMVAIITHGCGFLSNLSIHVWLRKPFYGCYAKFFGCQMHEAAEESLEAYPTFGHFFNRALKEGARPISHSLLVSPADGTVLHFGKVENGLIEFVKDNDYEVNEFLGPINVDTKESDSLYQVVIYLAPGDYHAFHSPAEWRVLEKIHFPGFLQTVRPSYLLRNPKVFVQNERVVLSGQWKYGYFSMTAVAAFNVGNIVILNEPVKNRKLLESQQFDVYDESMSFKPGTKVGEFRMGSTIVLIFEAPKDIEFCIEAGDKLRYGQSLVRQPNF